MDSAAETGHDAERSGALSLPDSGICDRPAGPFRQRPWPAKSRLEVALPDREGYAARRRRLPRQAPVRDAERAAGRQAGLPVTARIRPGNPVMELTRKECDDRACPHAAGPVHQRQHARHDLGGGPGGRGVDHRLPRPPARPPGDTRRGRRGAGDGGLPDAALPCRGANHNGDAAISAAAAAGA
jgi:hypothetical protein